MVEVLTELELHEKTPQELTSLLYESCIDKLERATELIKRQRYVEANRLLQTCNDILYRLGAGLNYEAGIIADQLEAIYNYMAERLIEANLKKDISAIQEVIQLLKTISDAWNEAMKIGAKPVTHPVKKKALFYDQDLLYDNQVDRKE